MQRSVIEVHVVPFTVMNKIKSGELARKNTPADQPAGVLLIFHLLTLINCHQLVQLPTQIQILLKILPGMDPAIQYHLKKPDSQIQQPLPAAF